MLLLFQKCHFMYFEKKGLCIHGDGPCSFPAGSPQAQERPASPPSAELPAGLGSGQSVLLARWLLTVEGKGLTLRGAGSLLQKGSAESLSHA